MSFVMERSNLRKGSGPLALQEGMSRVPHHMVITRTILQSYGSKVIGLANI